LTDRINPRNTAIISFVLIGGASVLLAIAPSVWVYIYPLPCFGDAWEDGWPLRLPQQPDSLAHVITHDVMGSSSLPMEQAPLQAPKLRDTSKMRLDRTLAYFRCCCPSPRWDPHRIFP
jgi:hypothetical protein